ncbi:hypothetical protein SH1V18_40440 [Vallitalea longa]|uniref:Carbohydrate-binding domain-containing protein n=1 Tax=Vallitalea longa TaxID=2936439 RepID=A0A9W6DI58_9FIRM|nr:carbohydrate-binding family 9-like protein [Vallitalea longa]GKX31564.1 hypothetical protein SH1V18_40440 [Vallitalea longa]
MNQYNVKMVKEKNINWDNIEGLTIDNYPWYEKGLKQTTHVKTLIHENYIKIKAYCEDIHSYSKETKLNGDVYLDSCFEFFVTPEDNLGGGYFNIEINCCGVLHMSYKDEEGNRVFCNEKQANRINITSSIQTETKNEAEDDRYWELLIAIPIEVLEEMSGKRIQYENETWYGNFYRCGGKTEPQYATWNNIEFEYPNFHLPKQFGKLVTS